MKKLFVLLVLSLALAACGSSPKVAEQQPQQPTIVIINAGSQPQYAPPSTQYYVIPGKYYHNPALPRY